MGLMGDLIFLSYLVNPLNAIVATLCFYFTLTFFQHLKTGDERLIRQSKVAAVICFLLCLLFPSIFSLYNYAAMMK